MNDIIMPGTSFSIEKINTASGTFFRVVTNTYNRIKADKIIKSIKTKYPSLKPLVKTNKNNKKLITKQNPVYNKNGKTEYYTIQISSFENKTAAEKLAKKAQEKQISKIYFDRSIYKYHGRVKVFAEVLRKNGMEF